MEKTYELYNYISNQELNVLAEGFKVLKNINTGKHSVIPTKDRYKKKKYGTYNK